MENEPVVILLRERMEAMEQRLARTEERCDKRIAEMEHRCHKEKTLMIGRNDSRERFLVAVAAVSLIVAALGNVFGPTVNEVAHDVVHMVVEEDGMN